VGSDATAPMALAAGGLHSEAVEGFSPWLPKAVAHEKPSSWPVNPS